MEQKKAKSQCLSHLKTGFKHLNGHTPVLLKEILSLSSFLGTGEGKTMLDTTFGGGGHALAFLKHHPDLLITAIDKDPLAIQRGENLTLPHFPKLTLKQASFYPYPDLLKKLLLPAENTFDIILLDSGISSLQLDSATRGFSFYKDGPLDMRINQNQPLTAKDIVNHAGEQELSDLFFHYGHRHHNKRVVRAILKARKTTPLTTTHQLARLILKHEGWKKRGQHPATAYFLALRLKVNGEMTALEQSLPKMIRSLKPKGKLVVITFHSLEDRLVKNIFRNNSPAGGIKKALKASWQEIQQNPRARSARLRVFEKPPEKPLKEPLKKATKTTTKGFNHV